MEILRLKKADTESIYSILIDWLKTKSVQVSQACTTNSRCLEFKAKKSCYLISFALL